MTPYEIKLLLDIYAISNWRSGRSEPIFDGTISNFYANGILTDDYQLTDLGRAHVIQLCSLSYPIKVFKDASGNIMPDTL